jgi:hypothetical protein
VAAFHHGGAFQPWAADEDGAAKRVGTTGLLLRRYTLQGPTEQLSNLGIYR